MHTPPRSAAFVLEAPAGRGRRTDGRTDRQAEANRGRGGERDLPARSPTPADCSGDGAVGEQQAAAALAG